MFPVHCFFPFCSLLLPCSLSAAVMHQLERRETLWVGTAAAPPTTALKVYVHLCHKVIAQFRSRGRAMQPPAVGGRLHHSRAAPAPCSLQRWAAPHCDVPWLGLAPACATAWMQSCCCAGSVLTPRCIRPPLPGQLPAPDQRGSAAAPPPAPAATPSLPAAHAACLGTALPR